MLFYFGKRWKSWIMLHIDLLYIWIKIFFFIIWEARVITRKIYITNIKSFRHIPKEILDHEKVIRWEDHIIKLLRCGTAYLRLPKLFLLCPGWRPWHFRHLLIKVLNFTNISCLFAENIVIFWDLNNFINYFSVLLINALQFFNISFSS